MRLRLAAYIASEDWRDKYDQMYKFHDGFAIVELNGKCGFVNTQGVEVIPLKYDDVENFSEGFAQVKLDGKYGFVNEKGEEVVPLRYHSTDDFSEGFALVQLKGKYGFVNTEGKEVIPLKYDDVENFSEGFAPVELNRKWGFVNRKGEELVPLKYDYVWDFSKGFAPVELNRKYSLINKEGVEVVPLMYNQKEFTQLRALVDTGEYRGTKEEQYNQAHEEFQIWKKKNKPKPDYMAGYCHVMALALQKLHPDWQIRAHIGWDEEAEAEDDEEYRVDHVYIVAPDGSAYDCRGKFSSEQALVGPDNTGGVETQFVNYSAEDIEHDIQRSELKKFSRQDLDNAVKFVKRKNLVELNGRAQRG